MTSEQKRKHSRPLRVVAIEQSYSLGVACLAVLLFALLVALLSAPALASDEILAPELNQKLEECKKNFRESFKDSFAIREEWRNAPAQCPRNHPGTGERRAENNFRFSVGARALGEMEDKLSNEYTDGSRPEVDSNYGTCERAIEAANWTLTSMERKQEALCLLTAREVNRMSGCYANSKMAECESQLTRIKQTIEGGGEKSIQMVGQFKEYLIAQAKNVDEAKSLYNRDIGTLRNSSSVGITAEIGSHGGVETNNDYKLLLLRAPNVRLRMGRAGEIQPQHESDYGEIMQEQLKAAKALLTLSKDIQSFERAQRNFSHSFASSVGTWKKTETDTNYGQYAGAASSAMGAVSGMGGAAGAATSALPLAAAAASGAAGLASAGKSSIGGSYDSGGTGASNGPPALAEIAPSNPGANKSASPAAPGSPIAPVMTIVGAAPANPADADRKPASSSSGTYIPPGSSASTGASALGTGGASASAPKIVTASGGSAGKGDDLLQSFNEGIKPMPAPPRKKDDGMNELNNIFGQFSKMFNPDPTGGASPGGGEPGGAAALGPGDANPNGEFNDGFQYGASNSGSYSSGGGSEEAAVAYEKGSPEEREMMQYGSIGTPLFQRVHARHRLCAEKGLLVQEFGRLPK